MYFRFTAGLFLVVLVSMAGVRLEKRTLEMRRAVSVQYYQTDLLLEMLVRLRLETQQLVAESNRGVVNGAGNIKGQAVLGGLTPTARQRHDPFDEGHREENVGARLPLLRFQHPLNPEGID